MNLMKPKKHNSLTDPFMDTNNLEQLNEAYGKTDFHVDRTKWGDVDYKRQQIDVQNLIRKTCDIYLDAADDVRVAIRGLFDDDQKLLSLYTFLYGVKERLQAGDSLSFRIGLAAISIDNYRLGSDTLGSSTKEAGFGSPACSKGQALSQRNPCLWLKSGMTLTNQ